MRLHPSRNSQPDFHLRHHLSAWLPFFMKSWWIFTFLFSGTAGSCSLKAHLEYSPGKTMLPCRPLKTWKNDLQRAEGSITGGKTGALTPQVGIIITLTISYTILQFDLLFLFAKLYPFCNWQHFLRFIIDLWTIQGVFYSKTISYGKRTSSLFYTW